MPVIKDFTFELQKTQEISEKRIRMKLKDAMQLCDNGKGLIGQVV